MAVFDQLQKAEFAGVVFPVREVDVTGGIRYHLHEYPHSPSAKIEKLGRKPYEIRMSVPFHANLIGYPGLWPDRLQSLRAVWESQRSEDLVIPTIGTLKCVCVEWPTKAVATIRSGESADLRFIEDTTNEFLFDSLVSPTVDDIAAQLQDFTIAVDALNEPANDLFDSIKAITDSIASIKDTITDTSNQVVSKLAQLKALIETADATLQILQHPEQTVADVVNAQRELWDSADRLERDLLSQRAEIVLYTVPRTMSVGEIATALYGDASRGAEILSMNPIDDAFAIKAGTVLRVYAE